MGNYSLKKVEEKIKIKLPKMKELAPQKKTDQAAETLQIEAIVGKKS